MNKKIIGYSIVLCVLFLAFSTFLGYITAIDYPDQADSIVNDLSDGFGFVKNFNPFYVFLFIFLNNSIKAFLMLALGFFFSFIPLIFIFFNGYVIGIVLAVSASKIGALKTFLGVVPHGIFELSGIIYAAGLGVWLGLKFFEKIRFNSGFKSFWSYAIKQFFLIILPILFFAALVETFITPIIANINSGT